MALEEKLIFFGAICNLKLGKIKNIMTLHQPCCGCK
jgi:hypothetical protein